MTLEKLRRRAVQFGIGAEDHQNDIESEGKNVYDDVNVEMEDENDGIENVVDLETAAIYDEDVKKQGDILTQMFEQTRKAAQTHMVEVKRALLAEKKKELEVRDIFYTEQMRKQQGVVNRLSESLAVAEKHSDRNLFRFDAMSDRLTATLYKTRLSFANKYSAQKFIRIIRDGMYEARRNKMIIMMSDSKRRKVHSISLLPTKAFISTSNYKTEC